MLTFHNDPTIKKKYIERCIIARLEDGIFEGLPNDIAKDFPIRFLNAVPVGVDLSIVFYQFMHWLLVDKEDGVIKFSKNENSQNAIKNVANLFERKINGEIVELEEWKSSRAAAYAADAAARQQARVKQADKLIELISAVK